MKNKLLGRMCAFLLTSVMVMSMAACGSEDGGAAKDVEESASQGGSEAASESASDTEEAKESKEDSPKEVKRISLYPADANISSGVIGGYKGDIFAEHGIELEVWAYSDEKTNAILASGELPDIMYVSKDNLDVMIEEGMLLNLEEYLDKMPHAADNEVKQTALNYVREFRSAGTGELYALPLAVGDNTTKSAWSDSTERNALKLRWDVYEEIGAPEIKNFDDLIDVMEQMMKAHPTDEDGNPFYGTVLNNGSDTTHWACMTMWYRWQGYEEYQLPYLLETNMVDGTYSSILEENSMYYQGLKWYNKVYRRGLMDPDSINNDRATQKAKVDSGYAMVPSGYLPGWATLYYEYLMPGTNVYYNYQGAYGDSNKVIAISADTQNVDACLELLDMWCDADTVFEIVNGPNGDFWYMDENGNAFPTEDNIAYIKENGVGGERKYPSTGEDAALWNTTFCVNTGEATTFGDGKGGYRDGRISSWSEIQEITVNNDTFDKWQATTGYSNWKEWLAAEDAYTAESKVDNIRNFCSQPDDSLQLTIDAIKDKVVNASWQMVYAESDADFEKIWNQLLSDCEGLGAADVIEWRLADIENARTVRDDLAK